MNVPVVMTVHNFRLICPTGLFMRNGMPCEICLQKGNEWSCTRYNCEKSLLKSVGYTLRNVYARWTGAYKNNVDAFACITDFQRRKLIEAGYAGNPKAFGLLRDFYDWFESSPFLPEMLRRPLLDGLAQGSQY